MSGPLNVTNDVHRFFRPSENGRVMLPYCTGAPHGPDPNRPFFEENEKRLVDRDLQSLYKRQPVWFNPRMRWPNPPITEIPHLARMKDEIRAVYANVQRFPSIPEDDWGLHEELIHKFLVSSYKEEWAEASSLLAMLRIVTRGIDHIVATGHVEMTLSMPPRTREWSAHLLPEGFGGLLPSVSIFKNHTHGKRLYANFVHFDAHWASIIWDKRYGQLYYFDSWGNNRMERIRQMRSAWKRFLREAGYPEAFDLCVVPLTQQPTTSECGYLALFGLMTTLRGLVGYQIADRETNRQNGLQDVSLPDSQIPYRQLFNLRLRDWCLFTQESVSIKRHMGRVYATLEAIAGNELGIMHPRNKGRKGSRHAWDLTPLVNHLEPNGQWKAAPRRRENYTWIGGWSPLIYIDDKPNTVYGGDMRVFRPAALVDHDLSIVIDEFGRHSSPVSRSPSSTNSPFDFYQPTAPISRESSAMSVDRLSSGGSNRSLGGLLAPTTPEFRPFNPSSRPELMFPNIHRWQGSRPPQRAETPARGNEEDDELSEMLKTPQQKRHDRDFRRWRSESVAATPQEPTPSRDINRSRYRESSVETNTTGEPETEEGDSSRAGSEEPDKYTRLVAEASESLLASCPATRTFRIDGVVERGDKYEALSDRANLDALGEAGQYMTVKMAIEQLNNAPQNVAYTAYSNSFCSLIPPGLMDERVWDYVRGQVDRAARPISTTSTRAERAAEREARREQRRE